MGADWRQQEECLQREYEERPLEFVRASRERYFLFIRRKNPRLFDRFMSKIDVKDSSSCWEWKARKNADGYGQFKTLAGYRGAHRVSHILFHGDPGPLEVRHLCHNRACVNPSHLRCGTHKENMEDRVRAGRGGDLRGMNNGRAILTDDQVRLIRGSNERVRDLVRFYGVSKVTICGIRSGKKWRHVK